MEWGCPLRSDANKRRAMPRQTGSGPIRRAPTYGVHMADVFDRERQDLRKSDANLSGAEVAILKEEDRERKAMKKSGGSGKKRNQKGSKKAHQKRVDDHKRKARAAKKAKRNARATKKTQVEEGNQT